MTTAPTSNFREPLTDAERAQHNTGRAAYHAGEGWEQFPHGTHARAGWAAAATEAADEATRHRPAPATSPET